MKILDENDRKNLKVLNVKTLLDLALILPFTFEDTTLIQSPKDGCIGAVEVEILSLTTKRNIVHINGFSITWGKPISFIIFHAKPYHYNIFKANKKIYVQGKVEFSYGKWQIVQPKVISQIGTIKPKYKTPLKSTTIVNLMKRYINIESLQKHGLSLHEANQLYLLQVEHKKELLEEDSFQKNLLIVLKYTEISNYLQKLSKKKVEFLSSAILTNNERDFVQSLPFKLTDDQKNAIKDIKEDLSSKIATKRVIMGDVGCGKTIVIFASVMMAIPKKSILMVPTTILAVQIFNEAKKYLKVKTCLVVSGEKDEDLSGYDFIIGTHALLYKQLPKCDLVMIDEQHRFGTNQRKLVHELVSKNDKHPHFLQFTATPIPRTLALINSSVIKYSFIKQMPFKKDISTLILKKDNFQKLLSHIDDEISLNRQIIIIYPLVEKSGLNIYQSLEEGRIFWEKRYKKVYVTHGKDKDKESVLQEFKSKGDILLSTTVVEVGISLPRLSTIVIVGAERLGLASLHQLRGRVSRNGLKGFCYLFTYQNISKRLEEFAKTKNGFEIAELDLAYRQSGDMLNGLIQHGVQFKYFSPKNDEKILHDVKRRLKI